MKISPPSHQDTKFFYFQDSGYARLTPAILNMMKI